MKNLTFREKIGQMLIIKIQGKEITNETKRMIEEYKVGGIILYRKNYDTYEEMINIINVMASTITEDNITISVCLSPIFNIAPLLR